MRSSLKFYFKPIKTEHLVLIEREGCAFAVDDDANYLDFLMIIIYLNLVLCI